jgi:hypothetical protein
MHSLLSSFHVDVANKYFGTAKHKSDTVSIVLSGICLLPVSCKQRRSLLANPTRSSYPIAYKNKHAYVHHRTETRTSNQYHLPSDAARTCKELLICDGRHRLNRNNSGRVLLETFLIDILNYEVLGGVMDPEARALTGVYSRGT